MAFVVTEDYMTFNDLFIGDKFILSPDGKVFVKVIPYKDADGLVNAIAYDWTEAIYIAYATKVTKLC